MVCSQLWKAYYFWLNDPRWTVGPLLAFIFIFFCIFWSLCYCLSDIRHEICLSHHYSEFFPNIGSYIDIFSFNYDVLMCSIISIAQFKAFSNVLLVSSLTQVDVEIFIYFNFYGLFQCHVTNSSFISFFSENMFTVISDFHNLFSCLWPWIYSHFPNIPYILDKHILVFMGAIFPVFLLNQFW